MPEPSALALRRPAWKWWVCGLLLLATMLNYMDRLTLTQTAKEIKDEFSLNNEQYGLIESAFSVAFGLGAIALGAVADRWNVRWVYPAAVLAWSLAGFVTGFVGSFTTLLLCRFLLGLTEAGHWPCALRTTQHILTPAQRTLGNSILQSGAAIGAIVTPLIVLAFLEWTGTWRYPFLVIGVLGLFWVVLWLAVVQRGDLVPAERRATPDGRAAEVPGLGFRVRSFFVRAGAVSRDLPRRVFRLGSSVLGQEGRDGVLPRVLLRRFFVLIIVVISINITWHFFRVWLPLFLREEHGYSKEAMSFFVAAYYLATDAGSLAAGFGTLWLARRGISVHGSRVLVFGTCALLTTLSVVAAGLAAGPLLLLVLLVVGFGALGLFPNYYSFSQELSVRHQGKVTGLLGFINWQAVALLQWLVGLVIDQTESYAPVLVLAGLSPLVGLCVLLLFWGRDAERPAERFEAVADGAVVEAPRSNERIRTDVRGVRKG
jgi:ACS family hexuronate transporter-like MFS transporter